MAFKLAESAPTASIRRGYQNSGISRVVWFVALSPDSVQGCSVVRQREPRLSLLHLLALLSLGVSPSLSSFLLFARLSSKRSSPGLQTHTNTQCRHYYTTIHTLTHTITHTFIFLSFFLLSAPYLSLFPLLLLPHITPTTCSDMRFYPTPCRSLVAYVHRTRRARSVRCRGACCGDCLGPGTQSTGLRRTTQGGTAFLPTRPLPTLRGHTGYVPPWSKATAARRCQRDGEEQSQSRSEGWKRAREEEKCRIERARRERKWREGREGREGRERKV